MKNKIKSGTMAALIALFSITAIAQKSDAVNALNDEQVKQNAVIKSNIESDRPSLRRGEFGVRYIASFSSLELRTYYGDIIQGDVTMSNGVGVVLAGNFSKNIGIQTEVSYLDIMQKYKDQNLERKINVSYLNIPVMLSLNTDKTRILNFNLVGGPQFGINVGSSIQTTGNENSGGLHAVAGAKGTDLGIAYGAGFELALNKNHTFRLDFGYRGYYGLFDTRAEESASNGETFNIIVRGSRMTQAGYVGLVFCF